MQGFHISSGKFNNGIHFTEAANSGFALPQAHSDRAPVLGLLGRKVRAGKPPIIPFGN
jgi:hypothetical protein